MPAVRGRPRKKIDYEAVQKLAALQCTQEETASFLGLSVDTLVRDATYCGIYKKGIEHGKMSLRRHQWKALEAGNTTMLIWLGKQYLGQRDKHEHAGSNDAPPIKTEVVHYVNIDASKISPEARQALREGLKAAKG